MCKILKKIEPYKRFSIVFIVFFFIQVICFSFIQKSFCDFKNANDSLYNNFNERNSLLINETVRNEQRYNIQSIKQSWINYLNIEKKSIIETDSTGSYPLYKNGNDFIYYNSDTMYRIKTHSNYFNIYSKKDESLLIDNAKPVWNRNQLDYLLNLLAAPVKSFGNNGGIIVYDSYSGEVFLDTTPTNRTDSNLSIFEDYKNPKCKNNYDVENNIDTFMSLKKDSESIDHFIYLFNEPNIYSNSEASNFNKYPLGKYNREFVEKIILPYESFGFEGQSMKLTLLLVTDEQDITSIYINNTESFYKHINIIDNVYALTIITIILIIAINMIIFIFISYILKYKFKNDNAEDKK